MTTNNTETKHTLNKELIDDARYKLKVVQDKRIKSRRKIKYHDDRYKDDINFEVG